MLHEVDPADVRLELAVARSSAKNLARAPRSATECPASRPRAMLMAGRSSGRPSRLLRTASVTNSSISLPTWRVTPRTMAPVASSGVGPLAANCKRVEEGRDQADLRIGHGIESWDRDRSTVSGQHRVAEAIDRVRELGDDRRHRSWCRNLVGARNSSTAGWTVRANSSNTRCWYCISVPNFAAWNRRSPSHTQRTDLRRRRRQRRHLAGGRVTIELRPRRSPCLPRGAQQCSLGLID